MSSLNPSSVNVNQVEQMIKKIRREEAYNNLQSEKEKQQIETVQKSKEKGAAEIGNNVNFTDLLKNLFQFQRQQNKKYIQPRKKKPKDQQKQRKTKQTHKQKQESENQEQKKKNKDLHKKRTQDKILQLQAKQNQNKRYGLDYRKKQNQFNKFDRFQKQTNVFLEDPSMVTLKQLNNVQIQKNKTKQTKQKREKKSKSSSNVVQKQKQIKQQNKSQNNLNNEIDSKKKLIGEPDSLTSTKTSASIPSHAAPPRPAFLKFNKRQKTDPRKLTLQKIVQVYNKKMNSAELKKQFYTNLFVNEQQFAISYKNKTLTETYFRQFVLCPFDHRVFTIILVNKFPKQFYYDPNSPFPSIEGVSNQLNQFYQKLYKLQDDQYYKNFLEFYVDEKRFSLKTIRNRLDEVIKEKNLIKKDSEYRKKINELLQIVTQKSKPDIFEQNNLPRKRHKPNQQNAKQFQQKIDKLKTNEHNLKMGKKVNAKTCTIGVQSDPMQQTNRRIIIQDHRNVSGSENSLSVSSNSSISDSFSSNFEQSEDIFDQSDLDSHNSDRESDGQLSMGNGLEDQSSSNNSYKFNKNLEEQKKEKRKKIVPKNKKQKNKKIKKALRKKFDSDPESEPSSCKQSDDQSNEISDQ